MNWNTEEMNIGNVKAKTIKDFSFYAENRPQGFMINKIEVSCGCTTPVFNSVTGELKVSYKPGNIPRQVHADIMKTRKKIKVYTSEGIFNLSFTATVTKK
jgi:hypothetical protein